MKKNLLAAAILGASALALSGVPQAQTTQAPMPQVPASVNKLSSEDRSFLSDAAQSGHLEIAGSKLALEKSANADVKKFAQTMINDHTEVGQKVAALAKSKGYEPPTEPSLVQSAKLKALGLRDEGFDKAYSGEIGVSAHEDAVKLFEKASRDAKDPDIKKFATDTLPSLKHHLELAKALQQSVESKTK
jgi:putative membrane protein